MAVAAEYLLAQKIIVIHPGSLYLRIGRASDLNPVRILHAIGRKRRSSKSNRQLKVKAANIYHDTLLPNIQFQLMNEFEEQRLIVSRTIQTQVTGRQFNDSGSPLAKRARIATPPQQIATFNRRSLPEELQLDIKTEMRPPKAPMTTKQKVDSYRDSIFDQDILEISAKESDLYNIHMPFQRGELNIHNEIGGSLTSVLTDLEDIWLYAITARMRIPRKDLFRYRAVLVISDTYNRRHLRELLTLLLQRLKFSSCFLVQDHVSALFGAGLGYACVVDVGDQKCSVSCVEDGISQTDTRVRLGYGGGDVTQVFQMLLRKCCFPYRECNVVKSYVDAALMMNLKERFCHLDMSICGAREKTFEIKTHNRRLRYTLQLGDECIVAPLSLFHTELLNITGRGKITQVQNTSNQQQDPEDCYDAEFIRETGRRNGRDPLLEGTLPLTGDMGDEDISTNEVFDESTRETSQKVVEKDAQVIFSTGNEEILPLDQAIFRSIERCGSEDLKRKMYSSILLIGGGAKFAGFPKYLEKKVQHQVLSNVRQKRDKQYFQRPATIYPSYEVNVFLKEHMDPGMIAWKGAAIMSCLESSSELWIFGTEWDRGGLRVLREKAPFIW